MNLFAGFNRKSRVVGLVQQGLANAEAVTVTQIRDCIFLLGNALGESWKTASKEAAAGMALVALARGAQLHQYLNRDGWKLVLSFVTANPEIACNLSPRTVGEIFCYRQQLSEPRAA